MVWALAVTETVSYGVLYYSFAVFLVPMREELGATTAQLSGALTLSLALSGLGAVVVGRWLDRWGARWVMTAGSLLGGASVLAWSQAGDLAQLYLAFAGIGLASAAVLYEPAYAVINTWFRRDRPRALLTLTVVAGFASTIFLPTSQLLIDGVGWRPALVVLAAVVAACALPHALVLRRSPADLGLVPDGRPDDGPRPAAAAPAPDVDLAPYRGPAAAYRRPAVRWLTLAAALQMVANAAVAVFLVAYLLEAGAPAGLAALAAGGLGALSVTGRIVLTVLAARVGIGRVTAAMLLGQAAGVAALFLLPQPAATVVFVLLFGAGFGVLNIARPALLGQVVPQPVFAAVSGQQALAVQFGRVVAPVAVGALITAVGYGAGFTAIAGCVLAAAVLLALADRAAGSSP
ncbi:MFS transporter [Blastococcus sp. MG754426]|uniref:MFS transporter n=1 Tax=unclassified Blastococcus TaxID=2619396 RepID=UPI001EF0144D|nr:MULTISPECIES: MFS transporter [unclassified Blastococcus]MCF6509773.1 MFS transporter [Blastococcus sp. MG754426]MCF6514149.1 MFS transporter [Blastococcus sp. MG754427]